MASSKWKSWEELKEILNGKKVIFWGSSNWVERTLGFLDADIGYIVDKSKLNQGTEHFGFIVKNPEQLLSEKKEKIYVIITTANYMSVADELNIMGFVAGDHYCCSPLLNLRKSKDDLMNYDRELLLSSPEHFCDDKSGGGLYKYSIKTKTIEKVYLGKCRGFAKAREGYYVIDMLKGIVILDSHFKEAGLIEVQKKSEPHGLAIDEEKKRIYVGQPGRDSLAIYSMDKGKLENEIFISDKWKTNQRDNHHLNDPFIHGNSLYIPLFSFSGNWLNEIYDGGILEIDLTTEKVVGPVVSNMWMPHSIICVDGRLVYLNSMVGELWAGTYEQLGVFPGFARGLHYDGKYYYIGISQHRYPEKLKGISNNISLDTGFYLFDGVTKMSRFFKIDNTEAIHSLVVI